MEFKSELTQDDYKKYLMYVVKKATRSDLKPVHHVIGMVLFLVFIGGVVVLENKLPTNIDWRLIGTSSAIAFGFMILFVLLAKANQNKMQNKLMPLDDGFLLGKQTMQLLKDEMIITKKLSQETTSYEAVQRIEETEDYLFIMVDTSVGYILPKRDLKTMGDVEAIKGRIGK